MAALDINGGYGLKIGFDLPNWSVIWAM
jgi:hypothetical protein